MISKELLSKVLDKEVDSLTYVPYISGLYDEGYSYSLTDGMVGRFISIYELAHKCKEWAFKYGYEICSYKMQDTELPNCRCLIGHLSLTIRPDKRHGFYANTEPEAIFKATQWILENKDK